MSRTTPVATTTAPDAAHDDLSARVTATEATLAAAGAEVMRLRELGRHHVAEGWESQLEQFLHERDLALAVRACDAAQTRHQESRDGFVAAVHSDFERSDATDVAESADLLTKAAEVERRRVDRRLAVEQRTGRQVSNETGNWLELHAPGSDDLSRLERWLRWARERRGVTIP